MPSDVQMRVRRMRFSDPLGSCSNVNTTSDTADISRRARTSVSSVSRTMPPRRFFTSAFTPPCHSSTKSRRSLSVSKGKMLSGITRSTSAIA